MRYYYNPPGIVKTVFNNFIWHSAEDKILLTFDDCPNPETTEIILKFLNSNKIYATFFCVGNNIRKHDNIANEIISERHLVGNHTFNHKRIAGLSEKELDNEISSFNHLLQEKFNYTVKFFRPPHGRFNLKTSKELRERSLTNVMWSLLTCDYKNDLKLVKFVVTKYLRKNSIVVLHDNIRFKKIIEDSLKIILEESNKRGFKIGSPAECLK